MSGVREVSFETKYFDKTRLVNLKINDYCQVDPMNPKKQKHRGRYCIIVDFEEGALPNRASVRFPDTNQIGKVALADLVVVNEKQYKQK
jgi:hypothetical protein